MKGRVQLREPGLRKHRNAVRSAAAVPGPQLHEGFRCVNAPDFFTKQYFSGVGDSTKSRAAERRGMSDDASLTDFVGDDESDDEAAASAQAGTDDVVTDADDDVADAVADAESAADESVDDAVAADRTDERVPPTEVEAATPTADWSPDGAECSACGAVVAHRWESETGLVCPDCKEW